MEVKNMLMQKIGIMTSNLASEFIQLDIDDRIPTVAILSEKYQTGRGTVQSALKILQEHGALKVESRGHLGTYITYIDHIKLLTFAGINSLVGVMPLPYSKRYEGLATGVYNSMNNSGVPVNLAFMRGANNRLKSLLDNRYDFAITSRLTAEYYIKDNQDIEIVKAFGDYSYVNEHVIVTRKGFKEPFNMSSKIGIDKSSIDQSNLTTAYFDELNVKYISIMYSQTIEALKKGIIDAAIWNYDDFEKLEDEFNAIKLPKTVKLADTEAVIITNKNNQILPKLFSKKLDREEVLDYQKQVLNGMIMPNY